MNRRLRQWLHARNVSVTKFEHTVEARRPRVLAAGGVDYVIDVGANEGQYATTLRDAGYAGRMLSLEPVKAAFERLASRSVSDRAWEARHVAVSDKCGTVTMNVSAHSIHSSMLPMRGSYAQVDRRAAYVRTETAPCETLDDILAAHIPGSANLAVKIDVQGMESSVLDGGQNALTRARVLEMEFLSSPSYEGETLAPALLARVFEMGFKLALTENLMMDAETGRSVAFNGLFYR
jgi:FkbM family methyltransferase